MQMIGRKLLHYEILRKLGEGGMGEVWLARDSKLDREVAIKVLPPEMVSETGRLERFRREAKAVASLNHPNIVTIHSVEEADGVPFFAMEYLDGGTLSHVIPDEGLPPAVFLNLAIPIADAVSAAHERGVTHRDLKPGNIMVDQRGRLKVLDFGLAKLHSEASPEENSDSHLETDYLTGEGKILGTTPYMSPEQLTGRAVDQRSDIFSLGTIFYTMVTGKHPFLADSSAEVISSILSRHPPIVSEVKGDLPTPLGSLIRRCLEKDPDQRYQTAHDLLEDLLALREAVGRGDAPTSPVTERMTARPRPPRYPYRIGAAAVAISALTAAAFLIGRTGASSPPDLRSLAVLPFANLTGDAELDHLAEGISAGLISRLREVEGLTVVARSEAWSKSDTSPAALRDTLGVGAVVDGEILRQGTSLRHTVNFTDADTGFVLWSHTYSAPGHDAYHLQQAIARDLAVFLSIELTAEDRRRLAGETTGAHLAFDYYVKGQRFLDEVDDPRGPDAAADNFRQALRIDRDFTLARIGLSEALWQVYLRDLDRRALIEAEEHALAARDLDPELAAANVALARIYRTTGRHDEAVKEVEGALADHPRPDRAYRELGRSYERVGDLDEAEQALRAATSLRPDDWTNWNALGNFLAKIGSYDESLEAFERAADLAPPSVSMPREKLATSKLQMGDFDAAIDIYESLPGPVRNPRVAANLGTAYFFSDRPEKWVKVEEHYLTAVRLSPKDAMFQANLGDLYQRLGRPEEAQGRYLRACELLEIRAIDDPDDPKLLSELADYSAKANDCERALALSLRLETLLPETGPAAHKMAYIYAMCGEDDAAVEALARAVRLGQSAEIIRQEDEFANLRDRQDFIALVGG